MIFLTLLMLPLAMGSNCPSDAPYNSDFEKCIYFGRSQKMNFIEAEDDCVARGGHLASVENAFENSYLQGRMESFVGSNNFWIGANLLMSSSWSWTDKLSFSYDNWTPQQVNSGLCGSTSTVNGQWTKSTCNVQNYYVCYVAKVEAPPPTVPLHEYCESGWTYFSGSDSCYQVGFDEDWRGAQSKCSYVGATLTSIHSDAENNFVSNLASTNEKQDLNHQVWIGMHRDSEGYWSWDDGSSVSYYNWGPGVPNHKDNKCVELCADDDSDWFWDNFKTKWNDYKCGDTLRAYVCKKAARR